MADHPETKPPGPFTDADRATVLERFFAECARDGVLSPDDFEVAGRAVSLSRLTQGLLENGPVDPRIVDEARLVSAWCRLSGQTRIGRILDTLTQARRRWEQHGETTGILPRLMRFLEMRREDERGGEGATAGLREFISLHGRRDRHDTPS